MKITSLVLLALFGSAPLSTAAHADIRPPPLERPRPPVPAEVRIWFSAASAIMRGDDVTRAAELCDARGYRDNLVGGSGNTLESIFRQGHDKGWHLALDFDDVRLLPGGKGAIAHALVRDNATRESLDALWVFLVPSPTADGDGDRWVALGAGEKRAEVSALADRWRAGEPLAPPAAPTSPPPKPQ